VVQVPLPKFAPKTFALILMSLAVAIDTGHRLAGGLGRDKFSTIGAGAVGGLLVWRCGDNVAAKPFHTIF
jgi:hypothetical protein